MISITVISVGNLKEKFLTDAANEYIKRLSAFCKLSIIEVNEINPPKNASKAQIEKALNGEEKMIFKQIPDRAFVAALCIEGKQVSSNEFSDIIKKYALEGINNIVFIIGSSNGLSQKVKDRADFKMSFSKMTFPHQLFRVLLLEQIYRAFTILNDMTYHK